MSSTSRGKTPGMIWKLHRYRLQIRLGLLFDATETTCYSPIWHLTSTLIMLLLSCVLFISGIWHFRSPVPVFDSKVDSELLLGFKAEYISLGALATAVKVSPPLCFLYARHVNLAKQGVDLLLHFFQFLLHERVLGDHALGRRWPEAERVPEHT